jgi:hypothetical protein
MTGNTNPIGNPRVRFKAPRTDDAPAPDATAEFQQFRDLTRKLTQVPKSELDAQRRQTASAPPVNSA